MWMNQKRADRVRSLVVAVSATVAVWVVAEPVLGFELRGPAQNAGRATHDVNGVLVAVASLVASLAGWALLAVLERFLPRHARRMWVTIAVGLLVLSLAGPLSGANITMANKLWLAAMHLSVGAVLIPGLARSSRATTRLVARTKPAAGHVAGAAATGTGGSVAMRILAIAGSLRAESFNRRLLAEVTETSTTGIHLQLWEGLRDVPPFDEDAEAGPTPVAVAELRQAITAADAVLIATPEYNGSVPGVLKNALDWASRPYAENALRGKPAAVIGASPSPRGAARAQADLRRVLGVIGAEVVDTDLAIASVHRSFDAQGKLRDQDLRHRLTAVLDQLAHQADRVGRVGFEIVS